ncbi:unnamed protein product [Symbiodinium pilosum]|uniref:Rhodanese domain-containing protein n=1 Tax=Symbiodinium pilosum TaxID=2952 RepID=A0A812IUN8_SYMPI|nr:unnamed protein product [Symbiodinium pilosum]
MAVHRRGSSSVGMLVSALAAATLLQEAFIFWRRPKHELLLQQVAPPPINPSHSRRFIIDALALLASTQDNAAEAAPIQYNAQLAGDLSEAQKRSIKAYLERHKDTPDADVVVGERPLKVYVKPTVEELTPDSPAFKARVARVLPRLGERLVDAKTAQKMLEDGAVLIDVRTREQVLEQTGGELPKAATLVPLDDWAGGAPPPLMKGKKVILTCFRGNKSVLAWESLRAQFADAYVLIDGVMGWKAAGMSTRNV